MASYLETQLRKQRHSKAIVKRNNDRRQLLLKQQPDVGDVATETSGEDVPVEHRSYWEDDEADGYDERIRWIRGPEGAFYYDGRAGVRTFGDSIPEGFISERELAGVTTQFAQLSNRDEDEVSRELHNAESTLSVIWQAAVQGTPIVPSSFHNDTIPEEGNNLVRAIASTHNISLEDAGRRLTDAAQTMRRDQVAALAEDGVYTTDYVGQEIRHEEGLRIAQEQEREEIEEEELQLEADRIEQYEETLRQSEARRQSREPSTPPTPYEEVGVSKTVFDNLSPWGQASLSSSSLATNNYSLYRSFPDVWLSDAGDAVVPSKHKQAGVTVAPKTRGTALKKNTKYLADLVTKANRDVDTHNRRILEGFTTKEGNTHLGNSIRRFFRDASSTKSIKEVAREDGTPEEIVSQLKERAVLYTFEEWMKLRDNIYERYRKKARNQQNINKEKHGTYTPQRVRTFNESGTGVIGTPSRNWIEEYGSDVVAASDSFKDMLKNQIPSSARVWPPEEKGLSSKDGSNFTDKLQGGRKGTIHELVRAWFDYNVETLRLKDPVKASNEANWGFASGQVGSAADKIKEGRPDPNLIISIANDGTVGAALYYSGNGRNWSVGTAGTSPKGFSSWPVDEITTVLESAINEAGQGMPRMEQLRNPVMRGLRRALSGWSEYGGTLESTTQRDQTDRSHAALVFFEFASRFLKEGGKSVSTSGISDYVTDHYKRFGFAGGNNANRLNILWTLTTQGGSYLPREKNEETGEDDVISKSFDTRLNKVAYTEKHDTIKTDNPLDALQGMLDNLMNKADERYGFTDKKLAQANEQELEDLQDNLEMDDEEFEEYLEGFMYMFAGTGHTESSE